MDQEILVEIQVDEGRAIIGELVRARIDIAIALWFKLSEDDTWLLYIGSNILGSMSTGDAFVAIYDAYSRTRPTSLSYTEIKYGPPSHPLAAEAIKIRDRHLANLPIRLRSMNLGPISIEEAYIYPKTMGPMSRHEVVQTVAALMSRGSSSIPASIELRDGSSLLAVPTSIQLGVPGELRIVLHDVDGNTDRNVSADEVVSIH